MTLLPAAVAAFEAQKEDLAAKGISVFAGSVDSEEKVAELAKTHGISFPMAFGVTRDIGHALGSWWDDRRDYMQPTELVVRQDGRVLQSSYSSGPLARTIPEDVISMVNFLNKMAHQ